jgi:type II secretory pathway pseudopilin PulG
MLAVLSVVAGIMAPYAAREIDAGRREATQREMEAIGDGLLAYYSDCGRMPDPQVGLQALIENSESLAGWNGPYVGGSGNLANAVVRDAWGEPYAYLSEAEIDGGQQVDYLLISGGRDHSIDSHSNGGKWVLETESDIVLQGLTRSIDEDWEARTRAHLEAIEDGLCEYYLDVGYFPSGTDSTALVQLISSPDAKWSGPYVRENATDLVRDPWGGPIVLQTCTEVNANVASGWLLLSYGPGAPDARWKKTRCETGRNDIYRVISASRLQSLLNRKRQDEVVKVLQLLSADIRVANPSESPATTVLPQLDPWGRAYRYVRKTAKSGVLYSVGANGSDEGGAGDDIYESVTWK